MSRRWRMDWWHRGNCKKDSSVNAFSLRWKQIMYRFSLILISWLIMTSCSIESQKCTKGDTMKLVSSGFTEEEISDICGDNNGPAENGLITLNKETDNSTNIRDSVPSYFEDDGACPYEGCQYGVKMVALKSVTIRSERDDSASILYSVTEGEIITVVTGVVTTYRPGRIRINKAPTVTYSDIRLKPGDIIYTYTYLGEGLQKVWYRGKMYVEYTVWEGAQELAKAQSAWWIKVRNSSGQEGWVEKSDNFREMESILYDKNAVFENIIQDKSLTLDIKLHRIDKMLNDGFDLNNNGTKHGTNPMRVLISYGTAGLTTALLQRGLSIDSSKRECGDQYWYTQSGLLRSGGLDVLKVLVDAGFNEYCMKNSLSKGIVCGVTFGYGTNRYDVDAAIRAVSFLAQHGFDVKAQCLGKTIIEKYELQTDPGLLQKLAPVANAVREFIDP